MIENLIKNWYTWWIVLSIILTWFLESVVNFSTKVGLVLNTGMQTISAWVFYIPILAVSLLIIGIIIKIILEPIFDKIIPPA